ncbi:hypothetical protein [Vallitalea maricola]|uniref:Uncharacterized protein n=1 Tax=Vallitalea maricola TaxID=3074433 RepID=A0ACB5UF03_9FIRM|nr:hypothetical protein AN2V17_04650 [Vallitalea sp. AN17-2]
MGKIKHTAGILSFNIKTLPKGILIFCVSYTIIIIFALNVSHTLNFSPIHLGEYLLTPLGVLLFTHLAGFEKEIRVYELTYIKKVPHCIIVISRVISYMISMYLVILIVFGIEKVFGAEFVFVHCVNGSFITALYLGVIGMISAYLTGQRSVGYIIPFVYYMLDMFTFGRYTGGLYLFSMLNDDFGIKINLLIASVVMLILFFIYLYKKL